MSDLGELVRRVDPDRYLCALFAPAPRRQALFALYGFNHELARACEVTREPGLSLIRLQWWREVVEGQARAHEVAAPLCGAVAAGALNTAPLLAMIEAREREADGAFATVQEWQDWLRLGAGSLMAAAAQALGAPDHVMNDLRERGAGCGAVGQLRNLRAYAAQGRCLLPVDLLAGCGLTPESVISSGAAACTDALRQHISDLAQAALGTPKRCSRSWIAAALPCVLARFDVRRAEVAAKHGLAAQLAVVAAYGRGAC